MTVLVKKSQAKHQSRISSHNYLIYFILLLFVFLKSPAKGTEKDMEITRQLAIDLVNEEQHESAAIEYRRLAMLEKTLPHKAAYYWAAAYEYKKTGNYELTAKMLDHAEDNSSHLTMESMLLRAENAMANNYQDEAVFYFQGLNNRATNNTMKTFACRKLAHAKLAKGNIAGARAALLTPSMNNTDLITHLDLYENEKDKRPWLGGLLGAIIPGLGYAYSGEYANAARSFIINGLFIYGMADTAGDEEWGAFTVISFFEITWYTGSIYGGIDSVHRYNKNRTQTCLDGIDKNTQFSADLSKVPIISLEFSF